ncbi:MAG TPA: phosphate regulon sensor histidine kinase PhoR [Gammaproteobacteria bacterium]|jgi:two-component system phosphate regulon sensor histidine kinase PhoR|nr:phosphate regulon sensor histidine kinase PhoR [Gammaproteobacteria bacterium]
MNPGWRQEVMSFLFLLLLAVIGGLVYRHTFAWLFLSAGVYLFWHLINLYRLDNWLRRGRQFATPSSLGVWGEIFNHFYRLRRRDRERKRRIAYLLREFRNSTSAMPDAVVVVDALWEIIWFNDAASRLLGLRPGSDLGRRIGNLIRHPDFVGYLRHGDFEEPVNIPAPAAPGVHIALSIVPYGSDQRLLLARDVTRLHRLEEMRRDFVANASHELRSPLTVVSGYLDAMRADARLEGDWGAPLAEMEHQMLRMSAIIKDLLELSRLETEAREAPFAPVDVPALLQRVQRESQALGYGPRDVSVQIGEPLWILGAESELYSAFSNLVFNAMRYTPDSGKVLIRWAANGEGATLSVSDTGVGIASEHLPRLTERFYRVDRSRNRDSGGTGLGLAIVKHVLQRHAAELDVESEPGKGSTFTCSFPVERVTREARIA